jgi:hypothetical protein
MCNHVLLELGQELLGFGEREAQLFDPVAVFLQHRYVVDRIRSTIVSANDQLHLHPHVVPFPLNSLTMELTLLSVKGYPRFLMPSTSMVSIHQVLVMFGIVQQPHSAQPYSESQLSVSLPLMVETRHVASLRGGSWVACK